MQQGIPISDAVSLAMHSMAYIASREGLTSVQDISCRLDSSEFHLSKVLQRLVKSGLVTSGRGPHGGYALGKNSNSATLLDVYEAIEGPLKTQACLMRKRTCDGSHCILGATMTTMWSIFKKHLSSTRISEIAGIYREEADE